MDWIMLVIAFILGAIVMFMLFCICHAAKQEEPVNRVRFYVARDKDGTLWLYMGRTIRRESDFVSYWEEGGKRIGHGSKLRMYGLNENDYKDLKWEDEPLEVFVNMED